MEDPVVVHDHNAALTEYPFISKEVNCSSIPISDLRWYLVPVIGTSLSAVSLLTNVIIAIVLLRSKHSHFFFLGILAISDSFLSLMYGPVIAMDIIKDRMQNMVLARAYWSYVAEMLALCQTSMTFSTYLIALATIERFLITEKAEALRVMRSNRGILAGIVFVFALVVRGTAVFEIQFLENTDCEGTLAEKGLAVTSIVENPHYSKYFRFYFRNITSVFLPFVLLAILNFNIVRTLRRQQRAAAMFRFATSRHKLKVRSATRLMVLIVFSYMFANCLNVVITSWEYIDLGSTDTHYDVYEILTDVVSVMYIFVCSTRLFVYVTCNEEIRNEVFAFLCNMRNFGKDRAHSLVMTNGGSPSFSKPSGAMDSIAAVAIARRLILSDINSDDAEEGIPLEKRHSDEDSPIHAIVIANGYPRCTTDADDV